MLSRLLRPGSLAALGLCLLLLWAPLPQAGATPGAELAFRLAAFALFLLTVPRLVGGLRWRDAQAVLALSAIALLGLVQSCAWPAGPASLVSEEHVRLYREAAALTAPEAPVERVYLSLAPATSRSAALSWLAAAALLAATLVVGRRRRHRRWLLAALVTAAVVQGAVGLIELSRASPAGLGDLLLRPEGRLQGTFANPNHLSLFFEIVMAAVAAWLWWSLQRWRRSGTRRLTAVATPAALWLLLFGLVVLTGSRAGLVAALAALFVQSGVLLARRGSRRTGALVGLLVVVGLAALIGVGSRFEIRRYAGVSLFENNLSGRLEVLSAALELWRRFPVVGTGLGTFEDAFPLASPPEPTRILWNRAHNDPVELLVTGGLLGLGLGTLAGVALLVPALRLLWQGAGVDERAAGLAAVGAVAAALFHEMLDFGLVLPANSAALLAILGSAAAACLRSRVDRAPAPRRRA